jgi:hypothetical protein
VLWMLSGAMDFACPVELLPLDIWWSYGLWMLSGAIGCFWMLSGAKGLKCLMVLWALNV